MGFNDRFQVVDTPTVAPGECFICKSVRRGPFVDTGITDPYLGVFYICLGCLTEMYFNVTSEGISRDDLVASQIANAEERAYIAAVLSVKETVNDVITALIPTDSSLSIADVINSLVPESENVQADPAGQEPGGDSADQSPEQEPSAPKRKGRDDVSGTASDGPTGLVLPDI